MARYLSELIKFLVDAGGDHITFAECRRCFGMHGASEIIKKLCAITHSGNHIIKRRNTLSSAKISNRLGLTESSAKLHDLTRHNLSCCCS